MPTSPSRYLLTCLALCLVTLVFGPGRGHAQQLEVPLSAILSPVFCSCFSECCFLECFCPCPYEEFLLILQDSVQSPSLEPFPASQGLSCADRTAPQTELHSSVYPTSKAICLHIFWVNNSSWKNMSICPTCSTA